MIDSNATSFDFTSLTYFVNKLLVNVSEDKQLKQNIKI